MTTYTSKYSIPVILITFCAISLVALALTEFVFIRKTIEPISAAVLGVVLLGTLFYYYSNSIRNVAVTENGLILHKNIGKIKIVFSELESAKTMEYSALPMSVGSKGVFGFIGSAMDGSISFVKDRQKMVQLITSNKKYLISCENPRELVYHVLKKISTEKDSNK